MRKYAIKNVETAKFVSAICYNSDALSRVLLISIYFGSVPLLLNSDQVKTVLEDIWKNPNLRKYELELVSYRLVEKPPILSIEKLREEFESKEIIKPLPGSSG
mgnify:CR=1 FL=1